MSRFNVAKETGPDTTNREGVPAYDQSPKLAFASLVLTNMLKDQYYRSATTSLRELDDLLGEVPTKFAAKAGILVRHEYGLRSISHALAGLLAPHLSGTEYGARFYEDVVRRPDDVTEILAFFQGYVAPNMSGNPYATAAMKKGLGLALTKFDEYQLDKYAQRRKEISLHDAVNVLHPPETLALKRLMNGEIEQAETWEKEKTAAGEEDERDQAQVWHDLLDRDKLGFFATLRNLRNIAQEAGAMQVNMACDVITNKDRILGSGVLPFNITKAYDAIKSAIGIDTSDRETINEALSKAIDVSLGNVPEFEGETLVMVDTSSSMRGDAMRHASLFASVLYKATKGEMITYARDANWYNVDQNVPTLTMARMLRKEVGGGTDCPSAFRLLERSGREYDRIVVLTDNQSWAGRVHRGDNVREAFEDYRAKTGISPTLYNFDLQGYGSMQMPEQDVISIAGFSPKVFETMKMFEAGPNPIVDQIEAVEL